MNSRILVSSVLVGLLSVVACGDDDSAGSSSSSGGSSSGSTASSSSSGGTSTGTPTTYKGTFSGKGNDGGGINVVVAASSVTSKSIHLLTTSTATGSLSLTAGGSVPITGSYDDATKAVTITGGGYTFTGTASEDGITGAYTGPKGAGSFSLFTGATVTSYCGTFAGGANGVWNFVVNGTKLAGAAVSESGDPDTLTGTVTGSSLTLTTKNGSTAEGTIVGNAATGTWKSVGAQKEGTWTGTAGCGG